MKFKSSVALICALSILSTACNVEGLIGTKSKKSKSNRVTKSQALVNEIIGDDEVELQVISNKTFQAEKLNQNLLSEKESLSKSKLKSFSKDLTALKKMNKKINLPKVNTQENAPLEQEVTEDSLLVGFPIGLLNEQNIFGGVITKVNEKENENLGMLKLTDLPPMHVRPVLNLDENKNYVITLIGCMQKCAEGVQPMPIIDIPVVGVNNNSNMLILDLTALGKGLDLMQILDPTGKTTKMKSISSETVNVEYDMKTLVFDITTKMAPIEAEAQPEAPAPATKPAAATLSMDGADPVVKEEIVIEKIESPVTEITTRWYLRLNSASDPSFEALSPTKGVGFFTTAGSATPKITRFSRTDKVKYFVKNVPEEYKASFARAFDKWNVEFKQIIGKELLTYEFIDRNDPRNELIVNGDIRYNVIEWDLDNNAPYDGLGPSLSNQFTGQTLAAQVLIQGPNIVKQYSYWYKVSGKATDLINEGRIQEANALMKEANQKLARQTQKLTETKYSLKLANMPLRVNSQREDIKDEVVKGHFEIVPEGVTLKQYLDSYLTHVLSHEIGHNLGLRHNFKGSLGSVEKDETHEKRLVSRSIMEYLGPQESYLNDAIGDYDRMAIAYGYKGIAPTNLNWFCTDEDQFTNVQSLYTKSPECSKSDASNDPFSFWEGRLTRSLELLLETNSTAAPVWTIKELSGRVDEAVIQLSQYALSADKTSESWTNFFGKEGRPSTKEEVKEYVRLALKNKICDPKNFEVLEGKATKEAFDKTYENLLGFMKLVSGRTAWLNLYSQDDLSCK